MQTEALLDTRRAAARDEAQPLYGVNDRDWPAWLAPIRKAARQRFADLGFPTIRHEDWRFTNVSALSKLPLEPLAEDAAKGVTLEQVQRLHFAGLKGAQLVFVNGHFSPVLSAPLAPKTGVRATSLRAELLGDSSILEEALASDVQPASAFTALNTAAFQDGVFIHVGRGHAVDQPIHIIYINTSARPGAMVNPRNVVIAERDSKVTVIESYVTVGGGAYFTNPVTTILAGENGSVEHLKFQDEGLQAYHIAALDLRLEARANVIAHSIALGAKLSRNNIHTRLGGEGVECILNGLYLTKDDQLTDHWMLVEHAEPHCNSHEYFNGILDDRSRGVFHGRIFVHSKAQKTDAKQTNKNLLVSEDATVNTKPQLEIYADDVKCTHGATIGQLNEESVFYLRSRGIGPDTARRILIHAFAGEIIERVRHEPAREELDQIIWDRLESNPHIVGQS